MTPAAPVEVLSPNVSEAKGLLKECNTPVFIYEFQFQISGQKFGYSELSSFFSDPIFIKYLDNNSYVVTTVLVRSTDVA